MYTLHCKWYADAYFERILKEQIFTAVPAGKSKVLQSQYRRECDAY